MERGRVGEVVREIMKSHSAQGFVDKLKGFWLSFWKKWKAVEKFEQKKDMNLN